MKKTLGEIFEIGSGGTPSKAHEEYYGGNIPWVKTGDLKDEYLFSVEDYITEEGLNHSSAKMYEVGTVLIAMYGATIGATSILKFNACTNQACAAFKPCKEMIPEYLYYFLRSKKQMFISDGVGGAQPNISAGYLKKVQIELKDIETQKRIVNILDKVNGLIKKKEQEIELLDNFVKARFVEMFGDPVSNPKGWDYVTFDDCLDGVENGKSFVCDNVSREGEYPAVLKLSAATYGFYKPEENKAVLNEDDFVESAEVHNGDLLFTRKNTPELVGMAAYVETTPKKLMMPDLIFRLNTKPICNKIFLWKLINHELYRGQIESAASGSAKSMSNISKERLGKLKFPLPPMKLQDEFSDFVKQVDKSKVAVQKALAETQLLFDKLMQDYFG